MQVLRTPDAHFDQLSGYPFSPQLTFLQSTSGLGLNSDRPNFVTAANLAAAQAIDPASLRTDTPTLRVLYCSLRGISAPADVNPN